MSRVVTFLALFFLMATCLTAIKDERFDFLVRENDVQVMRETVFDSSITKLIDLGLPEDAEDVYVFLNDRPVSFQNPLPLEDTAKIKVLFVTKDFLDKNDFFVNINTLEVVDSLLVTLTLSEGYELKLPVSEDLSRGSVYPKPSAITSDGQRIRIVWERENFRPEDEFSILVVFKEKINWAVWAILTAMILLGAILTVVKVRRTREVLTVEPEQIVTVSEDEKKEVKDFLKHLKDEEQRVIQILKTKEGACDQGTIRFLGNFSKAQLSRLLSELEERNVIYKEKRGKKNIIRLK